MNLNKNLLYILFVFSAFLTTSCGSLKKSSALFQSSYDKIADTAHFVYVANASTVSDSLYVLKPFDVIGVRNIQNNTGLTPTTSTTSEPTSVFHLDESGNVSLPVIGTLNVKGMTVSDIRMKIQKLYSENLLKNPLIEVLVLNRRVTLLGEITKPGNYAFLNENMNLIELIGESGGLLPSANSKMVKIIRGNIKNPEIVYVNLNDIRSISRDEINLQSGDIIYVPPSKIYSTNENLKSYSGLFQPALLILNALVIIYSITR